MSSQRTGGSRGGDVCAAILNRTRASSDHQSPVGRARATSSLNSSLLVRVQLPQLLHFLNSVTLKHFTVQHDRRRFTSQRRLSLRDQTEGPTRRLLRGCSRYTSTFLSVHRVAKNLNAVITFFFLHFSLAAFGWFRDCGRSGVKIFFVIDT